MKFARPINDSTPNVTNPFSSFHLGVDYGYPDGTPVYAAADGLITIAKGYETQSWIATNRPLNNNDYGNLIKIQHAEGYATLYAHLKYDSLYVTVNQQVKKGQLIAEVGSTGNSTGNHLHWELRLNEIAINPVPLMDTTFTGYFSSSAPVTPTPTTPPVSTDRRPYWFDLMNKVIWNRPHEQLSDNNINAFVQEYPSQLSRSGKWDQIAIKAGLSGDTNEITVDYLYRTIQDKAPIKNEVEIRKDERAKTLAEIMSIMQGIK